VKDLKIPPNLAIFLTILSRLVYFKITDIPIVKEFINNSMKDSKEWIDTIGDQTLILIIALGFVVLLMIVGLIAKNTEKFKEQV
jgi:hypothetical protein